MSLTLLCGLSAALNLLMGAVIYILADQLQTLRYELTKRAKRRAKACLTQIAK